MPFSPSNIGTGLLKRESFLTRQRELIDPLGSHLGISSHVGCPRRKSKSCLFLPPPQKVFALSIMMCIVYSITLAYFCMIRGNHGVPQMNKNDPRQPRWWLTPVFKVKQVYIRCTSPRLRRHGDSQTVVFFPPKTPPRRFHIKKFCATTLPFTSASHLK